MKTSDSLAEAAKAARFPRLGRGLAVVAAPDSFLIDGGPQRRSFSGAAAMALLPDLLPMLDGTTGVDGLRQRSDIDERALDAALNSLDGLGLLEWVDPGDAAAPAPTAPHHSYFARNISLFGERLQAEEVAADLASAAVLILSTDPVADHVRADLVELGVGSVICRSDVAAVEPGALRALDEAARALVVVTDTGTMLEDAVSLFREWAVPVVRFWYAGAELEVGPTFFGRWSACVECLRRARPDAANTDVPESGGISMAVATAAYAAVTEVLSYVAQGSQPRPPWQVRRWTGDWRVGEFLDLAPEDDCDQCRGGSPGTGLVGVYEWQESFRPAELLWQSRSSAERTRRVAALQSERTQHPATPGRMLPPRPAGVMPWQDADGPRSARSRVDAGLLADLFEATAGFTPDVREVSPGVRKRWAPTGGNLASVQLYAITAGDCFGLPASAVRYDDLRHRVAAVKNEVLDLGSVLADTDLAVEDADAVIVIVADIDRVRRKYDGFALRLAHLDAGCATLQLSVVAEARGLSVSFAARWGTELSSHLDLDPSFELITAVAAIHGAAQSDGEATSCR